MTGKLDEISQAIGGLQASTIGLQRAFDDHCQDDDRRHGENLDALREASRQIARLNDVLAPIARTVAAMEPVLANYQVSRWKRAGAIGAALTLVGFIGWLAQLGVGVLVSLWRGH